MYVGVPQPIEPLDALVTTCVRFNFLTSSPLLSVLYNYGRPIVYSTSLPMHSLVSIACAYTTMSSIKGHRLRLEVKDRVRRFRENLFEILHGRDWPVSLVPSDSPIQALIVPGNSACVEFCNTITEKSRHRIRLYPIRSPTVPKGQERIRVVLHSHNTPEQVDRLTRLIESTLIELGGKQLLDLSIQSRL